jgi:thiol:disulfide interchange protein/DsbC/DsbD-like thiol-disulfide interchange protein
MKQIGSRVLGALLLAILFLASDAAAQVYQGRELVKAELLADTSAIVPGKPFTVGLLLRMVPRWHTYWKFPGDAGIPTEIKWQLPAGWKVGEIQWPIPLKLSEPGDIQIYGYHDEVLLMQQMTPPESISDSAVKLVADASWLVCEKICIPGSKNLQLELPTSAISNSANRELFDRFRSLLPRAWAGSDVASAKWTRDGSNLRLTVQSAALAIYPATDFYPLPEPNVVVGHPDIESRHGNEINFRIPLESPDKNVSSISGLIVFAQKPNGNDRAAWSLTTKPASAAFNSEKPASLLDRLFNLQAEAGVLTFLFYGFLGGFILNLMPCVLPVISLKIFGFVQQAGQSRQKILRSGLAFAAGIFVWFIGLALILILLKAAGHQITWALQFTNPYFVLFMSTVVLVFALNLFGVFEISLPQAATRGLLGASATGGDASSFFQGVFATVLATPCTAPFLGTALGFAFTQSAAVIFAMFVAIATGMSAPYLLLSAQPAWLRFLPRPGPWMLRVKQFMGFLLLATLLFLLYVLGAQRGNEGIISASCFLLVLSIICWIKGAFVTPAASARTRATALIAMLILFLTSGFYFVGAKFQSAKVTAIQSDTAGDWRPFTPERLQEELNLGHPVFVDFTAAWCLTCKFNEANVLESGAVREAFQRHSVTKLKADWTNGDPIITKLLQQFGRPGVPLYVLYFGGRDKPFVFPELLTKSIVLEKLETVSRSVASQ